MNAKKAKIIRKKLRAIGTDYSDAKYVDSEHPKEKPHQKMYPLSLVEWTRGGVKNLTKYVPIKVGTVQLSGCGKKIYRHYKAMAGQI